MKRATINKRKKPTGGYYHVVRYKRNGGLSPYRKNFTNAEEAHAFCTRLNYWLMQGLDPESEIEKEQRRSITLKEFYPIYRERHLVNRSKSYQEQQDGFFKNFQEYFDLINSPVGEITKAKVVDYQNYRLQVDDVSKATVNREAALLKALAQKAFEWELIERNPLVGLKKFKEKSRNVQVPDEKLVELVDLLRRDIPGGSHGDVVEFAIYTGFRKENILSLDIKQCWFKTIEIKEKGNVIPLQEKRKQWFVRLIVKGDKEEVFPLFRVAGEILERNIGERKEGAVFLNQSGTRHINLDAVFNRRVRKLGIMVGDTKLRFHDLRHIFKRRLRESGMAMEDISKLMGHESIQITTGYTDIERSVALRDQELMPEIRRRG